MGINGSRVKLCLVDLAFIISLEGRVKDHVAH